MTTLIQITKDDPEYKTFRNFINNLRCPLCNGQLDGGAHPTRSILYCVNNQDEYSCIIENYIFTNETISYFYPQYMYQVEILLGTNCYNTYIDRLNMDAAPQHRNKTRINIWKYSGEKLLFFRKRMEEDQFLKKLKTYSVFI